MPEKPVSLETALRTAEALARRGETERARQLCTQILAKFPGNRRAWAMLDALRAPRPGSPAPGTSRPDLRAGLDALLALHRQGRHADVEERARALAASFPRNPLIPNILGAACAAMGRPEDAVASFRRALQIDRDFFPAHTNLGAALAAQGRDEEAAEHYAAALALKPDYAEAHHNLGNSLRRLGRPGEAADSYARALAAKPDFADASRSLAAVLHETGRDAEAVEEYRRAIGLAPGDAELHNNLGVALNALDRHDEAIDSYREALRLRPGLRETYTNLCELYEKANRIDELAQTVAAAGASLGPEDSYQRYWLAELAARQDRHDEALAQLEAIAPEDLPLKMKLKRAELLGRCLDRLGGFERAFAAFAETNRLAAEWQSFRGYDRGRYVDELRVLQRSWIAAPRPAWADPAAEGANDGTGPALAFMVGFPRSGTTLLDTVLRGHPGIAVVEEKPLVERVRDQLGGLPTFEALDALGPDDVARLRGVYLDELALHLGEIPPGRLVIDKLPLNLVNAGLIRRLFPEARFILALRHPCDCVLSCFMQNFRLNDAMASFLDLRDAAELYDLAMSVWRDSSERLGLAVARVRYEELVSDLRAATEPLLAFLGLAWDESLLNYRETALARGRIATPSYGQVTQGLYARAAGRWENYRPQMAPVLPLLAPWAAEWGYET